MLSVCSIIKYNDVILLLFASANAIFVNIDAPFVHPLNSASELHLSAINLELLVLRSGAFNAPFAKRREHWQLLFYLY